MMEQINENKNWDGKFETREVVDQLSAMERMRR